ncbi:MAG: hypothetical protein IPM16_15175 [Chloroflexi bacterium]|nr:hypothetical protein [Chloroflexota bacterium]
MPKSRTTVLLLIAILNALLVVVAGSLSAQSAGSPLAGYIGVRYWDARNPALHKTTYTLTTFTGETLPLDIPDDVINAAGGVMALRDTPFEVVLGVPTRSGGVTAAALVPTTAPRWFNVDPIGTQHWDILLCKFSDVSATPRSKAQVETMTSGTFPGIASYWSTVSRGVSPMTRTVHDWKSLGKSRSYYHGLGDSAADQYIIDCAAAHGLSSSGAFNYVIAVNGQMFNYDYALGGYSYGYGGMQRVAWLPQWALVDQTYFVHEMGHGYGMPHSDNSDNDGYPYDNPWDVMSDAFYNYSVSPYGFLATPSNLWYLRQIGLLPAGEVYTLPDNRAETLVIDDWLAPESGNYSAIFIPIPGTSRLYVVEAHKKSLGGFNSDYDTDAVVIYEINPNRSQPAWLTGGTSDSASYGSGAQWVPGETYTNGADDVKISVLSATTNGYQVRVELGDPINVFDLISPADSAVVTTFSPTFSWNTASGAASYKLKLKNTVSGAKIKITLNSGACGGTCSVTPDLFGLGWTWQEGALHKWSVNAYDGSGFKIAKSSSKRLLTPDLIPSSLTLDAPSQSATVELDALTVQFTGDTRLTEYKLKFKTVDGSVSASIGWTPAASVCSGTSCTFNVSPGLFPGGAPSSPMTVKVQGRRAGVSGKATSGKPTFTLID